MKSKVPSHVWAEVDQLLIAGCPVKEIAAKFNIRENSIYVHAKRHNIPTSATVRTAIQTAVKGKVEALIEEWERKGNQHRELVFDLAHKSLKKMKPRAPKNFREAEAADKIARRAAGLEVADTKQQTLINLHAIDVFEDVQEAPSGTAITEPIEAELVEAGDEPASDSEPDQPTQLLEAESLPVADSEQPAHQEPAATTDA